MVQKKKTQATNCESCEFYDWDEDYGCYTCTQRLDQDEMHRFVSKDTVRCPYYRYHNEYKTVAKQN